MARKPRKNPIDPNDEAALQERDFRVTEALAKQLRRWASDIQELRYEIGTLTTLIEKTKEVVRKERWYELPDLLDDGVLNEDDIESLCEVSPIDLDVE